MYEFFEWDGLDGLGRRAILAMDDGRPLLGAFQALLRGAWVQQPTDVIHGCTPLSRAAAEQRFPSVDLLAPVVGYRAGYKPGDAMRNSIASDVFDTMAEATADQRELTLAEATRIRELCDILRAAYEEAYRRSL